MDNILGFFPLRAFLNCPKAVSNAGPTLIKLGTGNGPAEAVEQALANPSKTGIKFCK